MSNPAGSQSISEPDNRTEKEREVQAKEESGTNRSFVLPAARQSVGALPLGILETPDDDWRFVTVDFLVIHSRFI